VLSYRLSIVFFILSALFFQVRSQDIHFSQYQLSPLTVNPASAGGFNGTYRFNALYRMQWGTVSVPYNTVALSVDARDFADKKNFNAGFNFYYDRAGDSHYSNLLAGLSLAYSIPFDRRRLSYLNMGVQATITQRTFDMQRLQFDNQYLPHQYGGTYMPWLPSNESFTGFSVFYPDVNAGIYYHWQPEKRKKITLGMSFYNILKPRQSFMQNTEIRLDRRLNLHASGSFRVDQKIDVLPMMLFMVQGTFFQFTPGVAGRYIVENHMYRYRALYAGIYTRASDAAYVTLGMDYNEWYVGLSYDLNYSRLVPASRGQGGWEIGLTYRIGKMPDRRKYRDCPDFM